MSYPCLIYSTSRQFTPYFTLYVEQYPAQNYVVIAHQEQCLVSISACIMLCEYEPKEFHFERFFVKEQGDE